MNGFGRRLLARPDLFPAQRSGEPWGDRRVVLDLQGGGRHLVSGLGPTQVETLRQLYGPRCLPGDQGRAGDEDGRRRSETRVFRVSGAEFRQLDLTGWEYRLDVDYQLRSVRIAGLCFMGLLEWAPRLAGAIWTARRRGSGFHEVVENYLRLRTAFDLLESGAVLVHSAALVRDGKAHLFPGPSGAGKSTLCRLAAAAGWQVLGDDLNVLALRGGVPEVGQVPFSGDFRATPPTRSSFPLATICRLHQAGGDWAAPISAAEAFGALLAAAPYVNRDPHRGVELERLLEQVVRSRPAFALSFSLNGRLAGLARLARESPPEGLAGEGA